jgi:hypothetical protein
MAGLDCSRLAFTDQGNTMKTSFRRQGRLALSAIALAALAACGGGGGGGPAPSAAPAPVTTPAPVVNPAPAPAPVVNPAPGTPVATDPAAVVPPVADQPIVSTWSFPSVSNPTPSPAPTPTPTPAPSPLPTVQFGTVAMAVAAEPACGFDAVYVTVNKIRFHASASAAPGDPGWTEIALQPARRINIAQMSNGATLNVATAALLPGHYAQTRLVLDQNTNNDTTNSVVLAGTSAELPLVTQGAAADGIAVGPGFDIANGQSMTLISDFDACRSVVPSGGNQYLLRPVITAVPTAKNGVTGYVDTSLLGKHVRVTAQQNGVIVRATDPDPVTGAFALSRLDPGSYDVVMTADGHAALVIAAVPITSVLSTTALNTAATPITLQGAGGGWISATLHLAPTSLVQPAFGSAIQQFASGTSVTIGFRVANLATGAVLFKQLPMLAPQLATYSKTVPLVFVTQPDVAPGVATYTIAAGAPGYVTVAALPMMATAGEY